MAQSNHASKHIMLSYQWDAQKLVADVYSFLEHEQTIPVWMDVRGGMVSSLSNGYDKLWFLFNRFLDFSLRKDG